MSAVRQGEARFEGRPFRRIYRVQQLSEVQIHQAEDRRRSLSQARLRRRVDRTPVEARKSVLRLPEISRLRFRLVEQARARTVSAVRRSVPSRKIDEA